jgi:hypothetical protein
LEHQDYFLICYERMWASLVWSWLFARATAGWTACPPNKGGLKWYTSGVRGSR